MVCTLVTAPHFCLPPALLSTQVLLNPDQTEEKPLPPPVVQHDTEAEKQLIREVRPQVGEWMGRWGPAGDPRALGLALPSSFGAQKAEAQRGAVTCPRSCS